MARVRRRRPRMRQRASLSNGFIIVCGVRYSHRAGAACMMRHEAWHRHWQCQWHCHWPCQLAAVRSIVRGDTSPPGSRRAAHYCRMLAAPAACQCAPCASCAPPVGSAMSWQCTQCARCMQRCMLPAAPFAWKTALCNVPPCRQPKYSESAASALACTPRYWRHWSHALAHN